MKKKLLLFVGTVVCLLGANSQNLVVDASNDTIDVNTVWDYDTIFVDTSLTILDDVQLTIEPGTQLIFTGFHKIKVEGTLISEGAEGDTIVYTVADTSGFSNYEHVGWDGIEIDNYGGFMNDNDTSVFSYCIFAYARNFGTNLSEDGGGAFTLDNYAVAEIRNSIFIHNSAIENGGAIGAYNESIVLVYDCSFIYNKAYNTTGQYFGGGAVSLGCYDNFNNFNQSIFSNCLFYKNQAKNSAAPSSTSYGGGAMKISGTNDALIQNCIFIENYSHTQGGAVIVSGHAQPYFENNLFVNNSSAHNGGAIGLKYYAGGYFMNNTIVANYSGYKGGAVSIGCLNDSVFFANNIIRGNSAYDTTYNDFYIDSDDDYMKFFNNNMTDISGTYTDIIYEDNINVDPLWVDSANMDFRLKCNSECINAGKDTLGYFTEFDLAGQPRLIESVYDIGAYETQPVVPVDLGEDIEICEGSSTTIDAGSGYADYSWSTTEATQTIEVSDEATYSVTVANAYNCLSIDDVVVSFINDTEDPTITCAGDQSYDLADGESSYTISGTALDPTTDDNCLVASVVNDFTSSSSLDGATFPIGTTAVEWTVTDNAGNTNSCTANITVNRYITAVQNFTNSIDIYPNPTKGVVNFMLIDGHVQKVVVTNMTGKVVLSYTSCPDEFSIDLTSFNKGMYIINVYTDTNVSNYRIIKE